MRLNGTQKAYPKQVTLPTTAKLLFLSFEAK